MLITIALLSAMSRGQGMSRAFGISFNYVADDDRIESLTTKSRHWLMQENVHSSGAGYGWSNESWGAASVQRSSSDRDGWPSGLLPRGQ